MEKSIQKQIERLQKQYEDLNNQITGIVATYNDRILQLQAEGQAKVDDLRIKREGTIQAIQALQNLISPEQVIEEKEICKEEKPLRNSSRKKVEKLSKTESDVIENTLSNIKKTNINESDIPDYLKEAYNE